MSVICLNVSQCISVSFRFSFAIVMEFLLGVLFLFLTFQARSLADVRQGVDSVTRLTNDLVPEVLKEISVENENAVFSPFGLLSSLAMILEASEGETREELLTTFNLSSSDAANIRQGFKAYCDLFTKYSNEPEAAGSFNSASLGSSFELSSSYKDTLQTFYCANVSEGLTGNSSALEVSSIAGVMSHWKDYEKLAVYTFLSHQSLIPFKKKNGLAALVPMIPQVGVFKTRFWENSRVVLLPLQAKLVNLLLVIPENIEDADIISRKLRDFSIPLLVQSLAKQELEVFLPQTAIVNKNFDFKSMLIRKGITKAFDGEKSNFSKASPDPESKVALTKIQQNAYFSTSFVALNSVSGISGSIEHQKRTKRDAKKIFVDQPFLFFILQKDTQLALLAGKVGSPGQIPS